MGSLDFVQSVPMIFFNEFTEIAMVFMCKGGAFRCKYGGGGGHGGV